MRAILGEEEVVRGDRGWDCEGETRELGQEDVVWAGYEGKI